MILILEPNTDHAGPAFRALMEHLAALPGIEARVHDVVGAQQVLTEIYLIGDTHALDAEEMASLPCVERVIRVSEAYRILGRHRDAARIHGFEYNGVRFDQDGLQVFPGLCAVDTREHVEQMMRALAEHGVVCTRMGAYKPRTSPYAFQGHGKACLPWVFELAGKYGIRVVAMEVTHESQVDEIREALRRAGEPTGVMLQIGTRNTQNFELLKIVGRQNDFPVLLKRGFGITLEESLNAAEYLASEGNHRIVFCLRGVKTHLGDPHRNLVDFAHVPVVKRLTRMPVCIDPSHSVGGRQASPDGLLDIFHATAQGVIAGANMILVDFHPDPAKALVDGPQALRLDELGHFLDDVAIVREAYEARRRRAGEAGTPAVAGQG
ncbi:3-deoxy-7-phosphoheptulonate synthase [Inmirania thermothiophila]|uniref:3-deoxy-D-arabinoheptulosonate-7-phosphate synthase n=1 Tax=Inmirania thermothiophila TaxID=1750597 RepID=A0A3N1Y2B5_9GAMM|nr:3-deoxy-7-phosphoheptulonate synthase [Inmirania thermothiophila]ROR32671.1 3-deoxy-D-arabinoheptulosonate-7-phosphate synthase [Inmirania thermothiophila]